MVVIMKDLYLCLELIDFTLHQLLCNLGEELKVEFDEATLHDLLAVLDGLLFAILNNFPQFVTESIGSLMKFFFCLLILPHVRVLV